ncbi:hypothetical protein BVC80_9099g109 [Macleaya cordata]|uniref:Uncharacterized protein n=1 Tax=Macleaya cordata TaxID=56857 RepID=A0A200PVR7_MACCD|nr:hypothetical protein BVC80_9099g109 [Macleaya cordata]
MDIQQSELRYSSMGFFGIYKESYKITVSWKKIFSHITLALILPLSILYLSEIQISNFIQNKSFRHKKTSRRIVVGIVEAIYVFFILIFSLLSTSVVSYTIATFIYTTKDITLKKVVSVVSTKVWMRLLVTFLWSFFIVCIYTGVALGVVVLFAALTSGRSPDGDWVNNKVLIFVLCIAIIYLIGLIYINVVCQVASVVSVMEKNCYGRKALKKSMKLIKGKIWVSSVILTMLQICFSGIVVAFSVLVVNGKVSSMVGKVCVGILCYLLLTILIHFTLVIQTLVYFVCKSYHHEDIDMSDFVEQARPPEVSLSNDKEIHQLEQVPV